MFSATTLTTSTASRAYECRGTVLRFLIPFITTRVRALRPHPSITKMLDETPEAGRTAMEASKSTIHKVLTSEMPLSSDDDLASAMEELRTSPSLKKPPSLTAGREQSAPEGQRARAVDPAAIGGARDLVLRTATKK